MRAHRRERGAGGLGAIRKNEAKCESGATGHGLEKYRRLTFVMVARVVDGIDDPPGSC
ncbi:MAG TPA: hypothetical protein VNV82_15285 [Bryobacteraceae bacterium]|nr:hypothetical protein [Bryobacteraceae bacterium]